MSKKKQTKNKKEQSQEFTSTAFGNNTGFGNNNGPFINSTDFGNNSTGFGNNNSPFRGTPNPFNNGSTAFGNNNNTFGGTPNPFNEEFDLFGEEDFDFDFDDTLEEEPPTSTLSIKTRKSEITQTCYTVLANKKAIKALRTKVLPQGQKLYEYGDEEEVRGSEVKIAIEVSLNNILDLTHKPDYTYYINSVINNTPLPSTIALIRKIETTNGINQQRIVYEVIKEEAIKSIYIV